MRLKIDKKVSNHNSIKYFCRKQLSLITNKALTAGYFRQNFKVICDPKRNPLEEIGSFYLIKYYTTIKKLE
jgi:hypothetical protein